MLQRIDREPPKAAQPASLGARTSDMVARVATAVAHQLELGPMIDAVIDQTILTFGAGVAHVYLAEDDERTLALAGHRGVPPELVEQLKHIDLHASLLAARAAATREIQVVPSRSALSPELVLARRVLERAGCQAFVALPLLARERLVGALTFALPEPHVFTAEDRAAFATCAGIFAVGIANARAFERERRLHEAAKDWARVVAHDLTQPLSTITSHLHLLRRQIGRPPDAEKTARWLGHVEQAAGTLGRMIRELGDVSRLELEQLAIVPEKLDLAALIRDAAERTQAATADHEIELRLGDIPDIDADPARIEQVLCNLLVNAIKYAPAGTGISVSLDREGDRVHVAVSNGGRGIAAEDLHRLFERYFRTADARSGPKRGLGLGLFIARQLVEAHGGRIWAESEPGVVTTFHFTLPIAAQGCSDS